MSFRSFPGLLAAVFLLFCCSKNTDTESAPSQTTKADSTLSIQGAWVRPAGEGMVSAAYLTIHNNTSEPETLRSIYSDAARSTELHESFEGERGMMAMRPASNLVIKPGGKLELRPGSFHIMLMQLNRPYNVGDSVNIDLVFAKAGTLQVVPKIRDDR